MSFFAKNIILKTFLTKLPPKKKERLLSFLPSQEKEQLEKVDVSSEEKTFEPLLEHIHWSWFIPTLKTYSENEQVLFLAALPENAKESLKEELHIIKQLEEKISPLASSFLIQTLLSSLTGPKDRLLPLHFLPPSSLKGLLSLTKKKLTKLIDFLSLFDLAHELKQIVETKILKKIYSFLSEEQKEFLKTASSYKDPFPISKMGLDRWDGDAETFRHLLHKRGLMRLGAALTLENDDLIWYVCHQLDIGRGNALFKFSEKEQVKGFSELAQKQTKEILQSII